MDAMHAGSCSVFLLVNSACHVADTTTTLPRQLANVPDTIGQTSLRTCAISERTLKERHPRFGSKLVAVWMVSFVQVRLPAHLVSAMLLHPRLV